MPRCSLTEKNQQIYPESSIHLSVPWLVNRPWFSSVYCFRSLCKWLPVCYPVCRSYSISGSTFRGICLFSGGSFPYCDHCSICGSFRLRSVLFGNETSEISQKNWKQSDFLHFKASRIIHFCWLPRKGTIYSRTWTRFRTSTRRNGWRTNCVPWQCGTIGTSRRQGILTQSEWRRPFVPSTYRELFV